MAIDVMLDLETLDNKPGAVIVQIAAAVFNRNTGDIHCTTSANIDPVSCQKKGMTIGADTVMWWLRQSKEAQESLYATPGEDVTEVLNNFKNWIEGLARSTPSEKLYIWCHSSFDFPILTRAMELCEVEIPWKYRDYIDLRTILAMSPVDTKLYVDEHEVSHNALHDCLYQIRYTVAALKNLKPLAI